MAEVLSQSEIDALLAAMAAGDTIEEGSSNNSNNENNAPVTILDDNLKFSDKDIQMLEYIHKEYTQALSLKMFKDLNIRVQLESIQEIRFEEFMRSIPCPAVINVFKLNPLEGYLLFETSPSLVLQVADIFFGGYKCQELNAVEFSENDKNISMKITSAFIECLEKAWIKVLKVKSEIECLEIDPAKVKLFTNDEAVALASFSISIGDINTFFNICIPYFSIESYLGKLETNNSVSDFELNNDFGSANLNIKIILDNIQLSLGEIMNLEKGTILSTHKKYRNRVSILVEEKHCFNGEVGSIHNRRAVKIVDCLEKDV